MIAGWFDNGTPLAEAQVWCPALQLRETVTFLIDTSSAASFITASDIGLDPASDFPLDDRVSVELSDGVTASGRSLRVLITFRDDSGTRHLEEVTVIATDGTYSRSRLGRDILNRWLVLYDPPGSQLLFEPARA